MSRALARAELANTVLGGLGLVTLAVTLTPVTLLVWFLLVRRWRASQPGREPV